MKAGGAIYREFVYGGHLLALGTSSIAASAALILGRSPTLDLLVMAYLFTFGAYMLNRVSDFDEDLRTHPERTKYLTGRRRALPAIAAASFLLGYGLALLRDLAFFSALLVPLILAIAYSVGSDKMRGALGMSRLKEGYLVKNVAVSFGWSLIPLLVGLYYMDVGLSLIALSPFVFLRLIVNTVFFDMRDATGDREAGVSTLPGRLGAGASWSILDGVDVVSIVYMAAAVLLGLIPLFGGSLAVFPAYSMVYRLYSRRTGAHENELRDLVADGEYILWGFLTYLGRF